jgi:hypothetical protein
MTSTRRGLLLLCPLILSVPALAQGIGEERALRQHFADGQEFSVALPALIEQGRALFSANWTRQEGAGRPLTDGTGGALADPSSPLVGARAFNRLSGPDANSCMGCHNAPFGVAGGGGDIVANVFVLGQRFDFATFDGNDPQPLRGAADERGVFPTLQQFANSRASLGMYGSGYVEMLARQITAQLRSQCASMQPGQSVELRCKGVSFGTLRRNADGTWDCSQVSGLSAGSLATTGQTAPELTIKAFHQAGAVVSLRQFSNNAFNHHHGIQSRERFGPGDPDGDGFSDELTIADVTAVSAFQAALAVPGRVIPDDPAVEAAVLAGEERFVAVGCASCHTPWLPLDQQGWVYSEPSPLNPPGNLRLADAYVAAHGVLSFDLNSNQLPRPRLKVEGGVVRVPAFTDLKLHDITSGPNDPNREALDMHQPPGSAGFFAGNGRFVTKKLWGCANEAPFFHHGRFTTLREAIEAHAGEAAASKAAWDALSAYQRDCIVEFLKTLQVLPPGTNSLVVDAGGHPKNWPAFPWTPPAN